MGPRNVECRKRADATGVGTTELRGPREPSLLKHPAQCVTRPTSGHRSGPARVCDHVALPSGPRWLSRCTRAWLGSFEPFFMNLCQLT